MPNFIIRGGTLVGAGGMKRADIVLQDSVIVEICAVDETCATHVSAGSRIIDASGLLIFPGLIDCHVHLREPGLEHKATMQTESCAAIAGGVTTLCDMPNTVPPTVTIAALADKVRRAAQIGDCDIRFFFGITEAIHLMTFRELWTGTSAELQRLKKHCCGVKIYLDHSTGDQKVAADVLDDVFRAQAELGFPLVCHCEDARMNADAAGRNTRTDIAAHSVIRSPESEVTAIAFVIARLKQFGAASHIAHLSTLGGLQLIREAKTQGVKITCEVAPHHLFLTTDDYEQLGTLAKMNPPLRSHADQQALWQGIADGTIDCIATDHAPHTLEEKQTGEPLKAPSGVPEVETMLPLLLSVAAGQWPHPGGFPVETSVAHVSPAIISATDIVRLCFDNPNRIFNLGKQGIVVGALAELVLVDPKKEWTIEAKDLHYKCGWAPYERWTVCGRVARVLS